MTVVMLLLGEEDAMGSEATMTLWGVKARVLERTTLSVSPKIRCKGARLADDGPL